ncbi:MAG: cytochrome c3 family protein [Myxococcota bacterium]|nr:cytochrome c3 family protein [Myxococcota bacterium]MDW8363106.1 cytochrome c3 family protein [Myxococcales bacterium]
MRSRAAGLLVATTFGATAWIGAASGGPLAPDRSVARRPEPRSRIVYPGGERIVPMPHGIEGHRELRCEQCHRGASRSTRSADVLVPTVEACVPCHDASERERLLASTIAPRPAPRIAFSHAAHARLGIRCVACHEAVLRSDERTDGGALPTMRSCHRCHGGQDERVRSDCGLCHERRPGGLLRVHFPEGTMNPPSWLDGMHHDRDFLVRHRWIAADEPARCGVCHAERECEDCHDGRTRPVRVHPGDFLASHGMQALRAQSRCASCHTPQTFCGECHARLGLATTSAPAARLSGRFHPPASQWIAGPVLHARQAAIAMHTCTGCHTERDCVVCHGAPGIGADLSPHPPGFRAQCRQARELAPRACVRCHGNTDALCP